MDPRVIIERNTAEYPYMFIVICQTFQRVVDGWNPCLLLVAQLVLPIETTAREKEGYHLEFRNADRSELPPDCYPPEPLSLTLYPGGVSPLAIATRYEVFELDYGPVLYFFFVFDARIDSSVIGSILSVNTV
jgi:hypothetical protein